MNRQTWLITGIVAAALALGACVPLVDVPPLDGEETPTPTDEPTGTATPWDQGPVNADYIVRGGIVKSDLIIEGGEVAIQGDVITCVAPSCPTVESNVPVIDTKGWIFPGLIDMHNHVAYDFLTPWDPPEQYNNRYQWSDDPSYMAHKAPYSDNTSTHTCEMTKYAEVAAITAGVTTIQGAPRRRCADVMARNIEHYNGLGVDWTRTNVRAISGVSSADAADLIAEMESGETRAYVIHLSEGVDASSLNEFSTLEDRSLVRRETIVIHGTGLGATEFAAMGAAGMHLVWSPESNFVLYGDTTDVASARDAGVTLSLAPDWTLSGSPTLLSELRVAAQYSDDQGGLFSDRELFRMVTEHPAEAVSFGDRIGRLQTGWKADLTVVANWNETSATAALTRHATRGDIALVIVDGQLLYGTPGLMSLSDGPLTETVQVCGQDRLLNLAQDTTEDLKDQTFAEVVAEIESIANPVIDPLACEF